MWERLWGYCTASEVRVFFKLLQIAIQSKFTFCIHLLSYVGSSEREWRTNDTEKKTTVKKNGAIREKTNILKH